MYKHYLSQIEYLKELIEESISLQEETKSFMEDGKLINAYNSIKTLHSKLTSIRFRAKGLDSDMKCVNQYTEPIRSVMIDEIVSSDGYEEYSRDYLSDLTDIELVKKFHSLFGSMKLHVLLKESSISNQ